MNLSIVNTVDEMYNHIDTIFNTALFNNADRIVFLNTYNNQSSLKANRFVANFLKQDNQGNETVISMYDTMMEINNINILYEAIDKFIDKYDDIPIEVWTDYSSGKVYW
jgi:hypothetical protein